jgi:hypothetical protein
MIARLGNVLYWAACGVAALLGALGAYEFFVHKDSAAMIGLALFGLIVWLVGRACQYILAGK